jgi:tetratricopeptide (TPR) repeat protein
MECQSNKSVNGADVGDEAYCRTVGLDLGYLEFSAIPLFFAGRKRVRIRVSVCIRSTSRFFLTCFASIFLSTKIVAQQSSKVARAESPSAEEQDLEARLWCSDDQSLPLVEQEIVKLIQRRPHSVFGHHLMVRAKLRFFATDPQDLYSLKQASDLAQQAVDLDIKNPLGYVAMADVLDTMGASDRGIDLLNKAEAAGISANWRFYFTKARLLASEADATLALTLLDNALQMRDVDSRIVVPYVIAVLQAEYTGSELISQLTDWAKRFPSNIFDLSIGVALADNGDVVRAHKVYQEILKVDPENREVILNDSILLYRELHQEKLAIKMLSKALENAPRDLDPSLKSIFLTHLGAAHIKAKNWHNGHDSFVEALRSSPTNLAALEIVTRSYRDAKSPQKLVGFLRSANVVAPGVSVMHAILGETLSEHLNLHADAVNAFTDAITLDPERGDYYNGLGLAYYRAKDFSQALKLFSAAMRLDPKDAVAKYNEACVLAILGRQEEALEALGDAVSLDPRLLVTARKDTDFASIRAFPRFREITENASFSIPALELGH